MLSHKSYLSIICLILVINIHSSRSHHTDRIGSCKQPHQIKEVAALLYKCSPRVSIEPVPIVDLSQGKVCKMDCYTVNVERVSLHTLTKKGKRCSLIATILTCPRVPPLTISISLATGGMYLYSRPTCTSISCLFLAAFTT